ncbi:MAG TPA: hypothetical protein RMH99_08075 [Sandaracinaceae bacterium LLY-WYZ-13_1]|nr:hypothetical protein [Sandaracinaceae bacterium LLY-WYZ-13_1]
MNADEVVSHIRRVDRTIRDGDPVDDADKSINISGLYTRYGWGRTGPAPLPDDAQESLQLADRTADDRWSEHFRANGRHLGVYRSLVGYYWLLRYDGAIGEHWLDHVGTAHDTATKFGAG